MQWSKINDMHLSYAHDKSHQHAHFELSVEYRWCFTYILQAGASCLLHTDAWRHAVQPDM